MFSEYLHFAVVPVACLPVQKKGRKSSLWTVGVSYRACRRACQPRAEPSVVASPPHVPSVCSVLLSRLCCICCTVPLLLRPLRFCPDRIGSGDALHVAGTNRADMASHDRLAVCSLRSRSCILVPSQSYPLGIRLFPSAHRSISAGVHRDSSSTTVQGRSL